MTSEPRANHPERGVTMTFVALSMGVIMGISALVIDLGEARLAKRNLATATDAAGLAATLDLAVGLDPCPPAPTVPGAPFSPGDVAESTVGQYLLANAPDATLLAPCEETGMRYSFDYGYEKIGSRITINASHTVDNSFAGAIGAPQTINTQSSTTAQWGPPTALKNLAPIGLCKRAWISVVSQPSGNLLTTGDQRGRLNKIIQPVQYQLPVAGSSDPYIVRVPRYTDSRTEELYGKCKKRIPSNYVLLDFNEGEYDLAEAVEWARTGYPEPITIDGSVPSDYSTSPIRRCETRQCTEARSGTPEERAAVISTLLESDQWHYFPIINRWYNNSGDSRVHMVGVIRAKLVGWSADSYLEFEIDVGRTVVEGICCGTGAGTGRLSVVSVCAVDPNEIGAC